MTNRAVHCGAICQIALQLANACPHAQCRIRLPWPPTSARNHLMTTKFPPTNFRLLLGDLLVLILFVFTGQRDHAMPIVAALPSLLTTTLALAVPWVVAAGAMGVLALGPDRSASGLPSADLSGLGAYLGRVLAAWLIAAPIGLILRALLRGQASIAVPFMLVILGLGSVFMLGWRAGYYWLGMRRLKQG